MDDPTWSLVIAGLIGFALIITLTAIIIYAPLRLILGPHPKLRVAALAAACLACIFGFFWNNVIMVWLVRR